MNGREGGGRERGRERERGWGREGEREGGEEEGRKGGRGRRWGHGHTVLTRWWKANRTHSTVDYWKLGESPSSDGGRGMYYWIGRGREGGKGERKGGKEGERGED